jgi:hypothetical protein
MFRGNLPDRIGGGDSGMEVVGTASSVVPQTNGFQYSRYPPASEMKSLQDDVTV